MPKTRECGRGQIRAEDETLATRNRRSRMRRRYSCYRLIRAYTLEGPRSDIQDARVHCKHPPHFDITAARPVLAMVYRVDLSMRSRMWGVGT